jgi:CO/xanthine dehydrogenase Mo-binding subunit
VLESSLSKCLDTIARQNDQLAAQAVTLERLFKAQADPEEIQTSTYEVADSILSKLGLNATDVRRRNFISPDEMPFSRPLQALGMHVEYDSGDYALLVDRCESEWGLAEVEDDVRRRREAGGRRSARPTRHWRRHGRGWQRRRPVTTARAPCA